MIRISVLEHKVYAFRDVRDERGNLVTCQYGVWMHGIMYWVDCPEGSPLHNVEPII